ncbi:hypothetical protein Vca1114GL_02781 [Vibrio campbellii]|nr:hypothetical protein Vca1114GL_02781 [Vibrio campbellii]
MHTKLSALNKNYVTKLLLANKELFYVKFYMLKLSVNP